MISKNLYFNIVVRVAMIAVASFVTSWLFLTGKPVILGFAGIIVIILISVLLVRYLNSTNRRLSYFFESVKNEDFTLTFPVKTANKTFSELNDSMSGLNSKIRQLRAESRQQEQYFQALLEHTATGIITYNSQGFVLHANSAAKKMLSVSVLTHLKQIERTNRKIYQTILDIKSHGQRLVPVINERETTQLSLKASSFKSGDEELVILSIQDIRSELDEKELDSWMKLIRVMMHEIMNSIAPIASLSESLGKLYTADGKALPPERINNNIIRTTIQGLGVIRSQGNGLLSFIESYRKLTRLPKPDKKQIRVESMLNHATILYSSFECPCKARLTVACVPPDLEIFADETQVSLCVINLVKNAMQANENNKEGHIHISASIANNHPVINVTDNGPGIPSDLLEEIFVPFFTTRQEGSGIGLSISRQIMRLHGGTLAVKSVPGKETIFKMVF